jgi:hypothetical protein
MHGSVLENEKAMCEANNYDLKCCDWHQKIVEKQFEMYKCFERDNVFIFDKNSWELLRTSNIKLKYRGVVVNDDNYDAVKKKLKKGIILDWSSIKVVKKVKDRTMMVDVIDSYRANSEYIGILKEMAMDQRVREIETWLKSRTWKFDLIRKIRNVHLIGKSRRKVSKWWLCTEKHVVSVLDCSEFEKVSSWSAGKIEKAICYLRWKKDKFKLVVNENVNSAVIDDLFGNTKVRFGVQVKFNRFLIWKYTVWWNLYAEITLLSGRVIFGNLRNKKKRRSLEVLFILVKEMVLRNKFERDSLYLINQDNLKILLQFIRKKRRRKMKEERVFEENISDLFKEEVGRNWKNRRKKPPDKIIKMNFKIIRRKEFNVLQRNLKMNKQDERKCAFFIKKERTRLVKMVQGGVGNTLLWT